MQAPERLTHHLMRHQTENMANKLHFTASHAPGALQALRDLTARYGQISADEADIIIPIGGDGFMLQTIHAHMNKGQKIYGLNRGSVGFLMNEFAPHDLQERIAHAEQETISPLAMTAEDIEGDVITALAINEVSLFRQSYQAAKIKITVDTKTRLQELVCDGVMVATPAGSTAYNLSAQGPIVPLHAPLLALTPVSPYRPRRWRGALLPNHVEVRFDIIEQSKRPVNAVADHTEVKSVRSVTVKLSRDHQATVLFDPNHSWDERILAEQFKY